MPSPLKLFAPVLAIGLMLTACASDSAETDVAATGDISASNEQAEATEIVLPGDEVFPEGVTYDAETDSLFIGSTADGTVYRSDPRDETARVWLEPGEDDRTTVTGLFADDGLLFVAGRDSGLLFVYRIDDGELLASFDTAIDGERTLINDVVVAGDHAYVTDSFRPVLLRLPIDGDTIGRPEPWLDLTDTAIPFDDGFNLNGITTDSAQDTLLTVHYGTGRLFAIDIDTADVTEVDLDDQRLEQGDGLELDGTLLHAIAGGELVTVELDDQLTTGSITSRRDPAGLRFPTTLAVVPDGIAIVNSQLNMTGADQTPVTPFTVSVVPSP